MLCAGNVLRIINPCVHGPYILDTTFGIILCQEEILGDASLYSPFGYNCVLLCSIIALIECYILQNGRGFQWDL